MTTQTAPTPPPPPQQAQWAPPTPAATAPTRPARTAPARTPWRDRLPELVGGIGTLLVLAATAGFLSSQWEDLDRIGKAIVLGAAAGGLTAAAAFLERHSDGRTTTLTSMLWVSGSATTGAAVILGASVALPGMARITALIAGLAIAAHALLSVSRVPSSGLRQLGVVGGLLVAAGPFGTSIADRASWDTVADLFLPFAGLVDPSLSSDAYLITGIAHLAVGVAWLAWSRHATGAAARVGVVGSTLLLGFTALELHVLPWGIGAFAALLLVLSYLVHGLVAERAGVVVAGTIGTLVAGGRVLWSLFSGEVATTIAAFAVGLALLAWAVRARTGEGDATDAGTQGDGTL